MGEFLPSVPHGDNKYIPVTQDHIPVTVINPLKNKRSRVFGVAKIQGSSPAKWQ
jgi:hypothetical protein